MDYGKLLEHLSPVIAGAIAGFFSWRIASQKNKNEHSEKEYQFLDAERTRIQKYFDIEINIARAERNQLREDLVQLREKLAILEDNEQECKAKLNEAYKQIRTLQAYIKSKQI